ncbi:MAG: NAD(P)-dependent alcohol dehydrogenase [Chitinispirillaceae bacterium]|nr:NAD(P)-dependent alcohol dehydrogenase [Chitinispirillaceae bacterium]
MEKKTMRAVRCTGYGQPDVLEPVEVAVPAYGKSELRIAVKASAVTASDIFIRSSALPLAFKIPMRLMIGITRPRRSILGLVFTGIVESVGSEIKRFKPGDRVFGMTGFRLGAYAEYLCLNETDSKAGAMAILPDGISFEEATAAAYGGSLALQFMDRGGIHPDQRVLVYGASGTSGTVAVQYAKYLGTHVTAVCSGRNSELVKSLGADVVVDYTVQEQMEPGSQFDFMLDSVGKFKHSKLKESCRKCLRKNGMYASIDDSALVLSSAMLDRIAGMVSEGIIKPVLDRTYSLDQIVEAHEYVQKGHKRGGVAIVINP